MTRRIASKVLQQTSRLMKAGLLRNQPAWYQAVIDNPPLPLPPRAPPQRSSYDLPVQKQSTHHSPTAHHIPSKHLRPPKPRPLPVHYLEDELRRQFFRDHPFEAFRPTPLVEQGAIEDDHPVNGTQWTRLRQRGRNPTPEDAVRFALNLHVAHKKPLSVAYKDAVQQFGALRSEQYIMTCFAVLEAEAHGAVFSPGEVERGFQIEEKALESWEQRNVLDDGALAARKRWKAVVERRDSGQWTRGQAYVRLWKEGVRPDYSPVLKLSTPTSDVGDSLDPSNASWQNFT